MKDNIPEIIKSKGEMPVTKILTKKEYKIELEKKLYEEYKEVIEASGKDRLEELADMIEVIINLASLEKSSLSDIIEIAKEKNKKRGSFKKRIFLEKVIEKSE